MKTERVDGLRNVSCVGLPGADMGATPFPPPQSFCPLDHGALGMVWALWSLGVDVLPIIRTDSLEALDGLRAFDGLLGWLAPNRSRPRVWMPRLELVALDVHAGGQN